MKKNIRIKKEQFKTYIERKKSKRIYSELVERFNNNRKQLNESLPIRKTNQQILNNYIEMGLANDYVIKLLKESKQIDKNGNVL